MFLTFENLEYRDFTSGNKNKRNWLKKEIKIDKYKVICRNTCLNKFMQTYVPNHNFDINIWKFIVVLKLIHINYNFK